MITMITKDKTASFLGDSVTYGYHTDRTYCSYLKQFLGFRIIRTFGAMGSTIAPAESPMYDRIHQIPENTDYVFLFGGSNDFYMNVPLGDFSSSSLSTFCGSYLHTLNLLKQHCPHAEIIIVSPMHRGMFCDSSTDIRRNQIGLLLKDYVYAVKEAADRMNLCYIDLYSVKELNPQIEESAEKYFNAQCDDLLHPNTDGHRIIAEHICRKMKTEKE